MGPEGNRYTLNRRFGLRGFRTLRDFRFRGLGFRVDFGFVF